MKIELIDLSVRDLVAGYHDDGVVDFAGNLGRFYVRGDRKYGRIVFRRRSGK